MGRSRRRAARLAKEAAKHAANGFPKCTQSQVSERFAICLLCEHYTGDEGGGECLLCECNCNGDVKFLNKLAWRDQVCPLLKWEEIE